MASGVRFAHVNLIANDWRQLARFYEDVLGCVPVLPERRLAGNRLARATGVPDAKIQGVHLRLPGYEDTGPTLEIFQYDPRLDSPPAAANQRGLGHVAFSVDDVAAMRDAVLAAGGGSVGEVVTLAVSGSYAVTFAYVRDPEGNMVELQSWSVLEVEEDGAPST